MKSIEAATIRAWSRQAPKDRALSKAILSLDLAADDCEQGKTVKGGGAALVARKREELKSHLARIQGPGRG